MEPKRSPPPSARSDVGALEVDTTVYVGVGLVVAAGASAGAGAGAGAGAAGAGGVRSCTARRRSATSEFIIVVAPSFHKTAHLAPSISAHLAPSTSTTHPANQPPGASMPLLDVTDVNIFNQHF